MTAALAVIFVLLAAWWLWRVGLFPLIPLVPFALAFPPIISYAGHALGWPGAWLSTRVALVICLAVAVVWSVARRDFPHRRIPGMWFVAPYLVLVVVSVLWVVLGVYNGDAGALANEFVSWIIPAVMFLLVASSRVDDATLTGASRAIAVAAAGVAIYSGLQALVLTGYEQLVPDPIVQLTQFGRSDLWFGAARLYGTLPNLGPNFLGAFLLFPTVLAFSRAVGASAWPRWGWALAAVAGVGVIAGTYSRGAMLALALALALLPVWRRSMQGFVAVIAAVGGAGLLALQTPIGRHAAELYAGGELDVSASSRVFLWNEILRTGTLHPFGLGFNGWPRASRASTEVGLLDPPESLGAPHPAENQWMRELADRGIPGVLALLVLCVGFVRVTYRGVVAARSSPVTYDFLSAAGAAGVGWMVAFLTGDQLMYDSVAGMFWLMVALALAALRDCVGIPIHEPVTARVPAPTGLNK